MDVTRRTAPIGGERDDGPDRKGEETAVEDPADIEIETKAVDIGNKDILDGLEAAGQILILIIDIKLIIEEYLYHSQK